MANLDQLKKNNSKTVQQTFHIKEEQREKLKMLKNDTNRSISDIVRIALDNFLKDIKL